MSGKNLQFLRAPPKFQPPLLALAPVPLVAVAVRDGPRWKPRIQPGGLECRGNFPFPAWSWWWSGGLGSKSGVGKAAPLFCAGDESRSGLPSAVTIKLLQHRAHKALA